MNTVIGLRMNLWIKILISGLSLFSFHTKACELVNKNIISLSGPISTYLNELGVIDQVQGISTYHPIKDFKNSRYPGGIYLSTSTLKSFENKVVFFDRSREFRKVLNRFPKIKAIEIDSRRKTPQEVIELSRTQLADYLKGCDVQIKAIEEKVLNLEKFIKSNIKKIKQSVFFLGRIDKKYPETVMANDGFVYWLKKEKLIESYPSELEYLNWSMKLLSPLREKYYFFGLQDSFNDGEKKIEKISATTYNVKYPGALTPGYTQLEFVKYLIDYFLE